jgi:hypothetical protein
MTGKFLHPVYRPRRECFHAQGWHERHALVALQDEEPVGDFRLLVLVEMPANPGRNKVSPISSLQATDHE